MKKFLVMMMALVLAIGTQAQETVTLVGQVQDVFLKRPLVAKISVYETDSTTCVLDSVQVNIIEDDDGSIMIAPYYAPVKAVQHDYLIRAELQGYDVEWLKVSVTNTTEKELALPLIKMRRARHVTLNEVVVTATKVKMFYRGDTIVYDATAFKLPDGSMLDDLIRQMPGVTMNDGGEIFVNGKKVDELLLNSRSFFGGNKQILFENLPYYTVKHIKVYNKKDKRDEILGRDDGVKQYVMDVNLKQEYQRGYIANVEVGASTEDAYLVRLFGLRFTDVSRLAVVGGMNNLNMSDYSFSGYANDEGAREGRTVSNLLTAELMTEHKRQKNVLTVELNRKKSERGTDEIQETFHNEGSTFCTLQNSQINKNLGASLTNKYTLKVPFWMESTTQLRFNDKKDDSNERYYESGADTRAQFIAESANGSVRDLEGVVNSLMAYSIVYNSSIDMRLAERVIKWAVKVDNHPLTVDDIVEKVCGHYNVPQQQVFSKSRKRDYVLVRQVSMYLAQKYTKIPASRIGQLIGGRDHSTVLHSCSTVEQRLKVDKAFSSEISSIENSFKLKK